MRDLCILCSLLSASALLQQQQALERQILLQAPGAHPHESVSTFHVDAPDASKPDSILWKRLASIDPISRATHGWFDCFVVIYWGCVLLFFALMAFRMAYYPEKVQILFSEETKSSMNRSWSFGRTESVRTGDDGLGTRTLARDFWSLCMLINYGQVQDWKGRQARPLPWYLLAFCMGLMQLSALAFILEGINPDASPWTTTPSAHWVRSGTSVNCMKFIMVSFLGLSVTTEASGAYRNWVSAAQFMPEEKDSPPTIFAVLVPCFHYLITLGTILGGVAVVLSCQQTPSILYNSLAILFITRVDEVVYEYCSEMFGLNVDWVIPAPNWDILEWKSMLLRQFVVAVPMLWGYALLGRAWYTNIMPVSALISMEFVNTILGS